MKTEIRKKRIVKLRLTRRREIHMFADTPLAKSKGVITARDVEGKRFSIKRQCWIGTEFSTDGGKTFQAASSETLSLINVTGSNSYGWWIHNR